MSAHEWELFRGLEPGVRDAILDLGSRQAVAAGEVLFRLGDEAARFFLVEKGRVDLTLPLKVDGKSEDVLVEDRVAGQLLGWSGLVPPHRFTLQARAPEDAELLSFPRQDVLDFLAGRPEAGAVVFSNLVRIVGQRLQVFQTMWLREMQRAVERRRA